MMWIVGSPRTYAFTFLVGMACGFFLGAHATCADTLTPGDPIASYGYDAPSQTVTIWGVIGAETPLMLDYEISAHHWTVKYLGLNSPGGSVEAAFKLADMVAKRHWNTVAYRCESACPIVWVAGVHRIVEPGTIMGVHEAYDKLDFGHKPDDHWTTIIARWLFSHDCPLMVCADMVVTPPESMRYLTKTEMKAWTR